MWDYFEGIYCINLPHRVDRWNTAQIEFEKAGLGKLVERFDGVPNTEEPAIGCRTAHINVIKHAKARNLKNVLIFEDDIEYLAPSNELLPTILEQLKNIDDWGLCYFGSCPGYRNGIAVYGKIISQVSDNILEGQGFWCGTAYAVSNSVYDDIINNEGKYKQIDKLLASYISVSHRTLHVYPALFRQISSYSDIQKKVVLNAIHVEEFLDEQVKLIKAAVAANTKQQG